jgi:pimeloyl-ACP methyl ester carboxylesterase
LPALPRTALLLHGLYLDRDSWSPILPALHAAQWTTLAPNLPGHGDNTTSPATDSDAAATWLADAVHDEQAPLTLIAHGLGTLYALAWAAHAPARVQRLVLIDPTHGLRSTPSGRITTDLTNMMLRLTTVPWQLDLLTRAYARRSPVAEADIRRSVLAHADDPARMRAIWHAASALDVLPLLPRVTAPVSLLCGDRLDPALDQPRRMLRHLPAATLKVVAGAGSLVHWDQPHAVLDALTDQVT